MLTGIAARTHKGRQLITRLQKALDDMLTSPPNKEERVNNNTVVPPSTTEAHMPIPRISNAPAIMQTRDLTAKQNLITTACTHCQQTCNNTPGAIPAIQQVTPMLSPPETRPTTDHRKAPIAQGTHHHSTSDYHPAGPSTRWNTSKHKIG